METWRDRAKARMAEQRVGHADLVDLFGVKTRGAVSHYLGGRNEPPLEAIVALADRLGMSLDELLRGNASAPAPSQSGRPDFEKIAGVVRVVHDFLAYENEPSAGVYDPEMLAIAWEVVERSGQQLTPDNVVQFVRRFRQVVAEGDDSGERLLGQHRG